MKVLFPENDQCKTWEEEMYWKHFHTMHFYLVLPKDFHDQLVLPSKFAEHMSSKLPNKVSLIGPSGSSWDVEVSKTGSLALAGDGWKDFAKSYSLEENFLVMFKYKQNSCFEALIFDQKNLCERESTYFVKKSLPKPAHRIDRKRSVGEAATAEMMEGNDDGGGSGSGGGGGDFEPVPSKKQKTGTAEKGHLNSPEAPRTSPSDASSEDHTSEDDHTDPELTSDEAIDDIIVEAISSGGRKNHEGSINEAAAQDEGRPSEPTKSKAQSARKPSDNNTATELIRSNEMEKIPTANGERELFDKVILTASNVFSDTLLSAEPNGDSSPGTNHSRKPTGKRGRPAKRALPKNSGRKLVFKNTTKRLSKEYMSRRRPVTNEEKEDALRRANEALTEGGFIVVMRPTGVYKRFYLNIPSDWMHKNLRRQHLQVILRVGEKTWETMFHHYGRRGHSGGLASGWKNFTIHNNLEDSDVCLFKPATPTDDDTLVLDVEIFRVVPEITPLAPLICSI